MSAIETIKSLPFFNEFDEGQLAALAKLCSEKEYLRGTRIFTEGESATQIFVLAQGAVELRFELPAREADAAQTISVIEEGQAFGWSVFVQPYKYRFSAYCTARITKVLVMEKKELDQLCASDETLGFYFLANVVRLVGARFHHLQQTSMSTGYATTKILVHMGTCGIAKGAREIMQTAADELANAGRSDIELVSAGCLGNCSDEPQMTIETTGQAPVIYGKMTLEKVKEVFQRHVLGGEVISAYLVDN
ncbi:cyclic nucleotide-binding domain-containing protein [Desulfobacterales bacterium HSG17]|nr:cyclic nucleotide-binding domain-containing protein [Desulfobacterales bacterium HSG17]